MNMPDQPLVRQKCVPCEGGIPPLGREAASGYLSQTPGWAMSEDGKWISRDFKFKNFKESMVFVNKVAEIAEAEGHHPDVKIVWNKVRLDLTTHAIRGLFVNDFILAAKVNELLD